MQKIHCMSGYIAFGKTTIAKQLAKQYQAHRITPDEIMKEKYGTTVSDDFLEKADKLDCFVWAEIQKYLSQGIDVIFDTGPWTIQSRQHIMKQAQALQAEVIWHQVICDIETARQRLINRSQNQTELSIDTRFFDEHLSAYQPITEAEQLTVIYHDNNK